MKQGGSPWFRVLGGVAIVNVMLVLGLLVLGLDQHEPTHGAGLLVIFISLATGMLLFLKRQRQQAFPGALMLLHGLLGSLAVALAAWALT